MITEVRTATFDSLSTTFLRLRIDITKNSAGPCGLSLDFERRDSNGSLNSRTRKWCTMEKFIGGKSHPRLLLADDHAMFSDALRLYLEKDFDIVGVVSDGRALVDEAIRIMPDVIIVDVGMPLLNGLDAARRIKEQAPKIKFIFLTMRDDPNLAAAALELGPVAFVLKHSAGPELLEAINEVMRGHSYLTPKLRATDWVEAKARVRQFSKDMTPRQRDIVQLFAEGRPMKEIAGYLH